MSSNTTSSTPAQEIRISGDTIGVTVDDIPAVIRESIIKQGELPSESLTKKEVKYLRAITDPIFTATPETDIPRQQSPIRHCVIPARLKQLEATPSSERIPVVTWPETAVYLCTGALLKAQFSAAEPLEYYRYAVAKTWAEYEPFIEDGAWETPNAPVETPEDVKPRDATNTLTSVRKSLKADRDDAFLSTVYPDINTDTSKAFWNR
ncbi:hypothetical protein [Salinibaculum rarum]|uniref:hypothetical protein n=1 Tax=Salinibaculum rarum TaxID=3058903 RepID=UPI00265FCBC1|nr:hypothetical protein [Salinibaculum sp. KK48]